MIFEVFISVDANATPRYYTLHLCCTSTCVDEKPQAVQQDVQKTVLGKPEILNTTQSVQLSQAYSEMFIIVSALLKENETDLMTAKPSGNQQEASS